MKRSTLLKQSRSLIDPYRGTKGDRFRWNADLAACTKTQLAGF